MARSIPTQDFRTAIKSLNETLVKTNKPKIKFVGVKKEVVIEEFINTVLNFIEDKETKLLSEKVIDFYNTYVATEEDPDGTKKVAAKKAPAKKTPKETAKKVAAKKAPAKKAFVKKAPKKTAEKTPKLKVGYEVIRIIVDNGNTLDKKLILKELVKVFPDRDQSGMAVSITHITSVMNNYFTYTAIEPTA